MSPIENKTIKIKFSQGGVETYKKQIRVQHTFVDLNLLHPECRGVVRHDVLHRIVCYRTHFFDQRG